MNIINHPANVFLLFTAITTVISFLFIYLGKIIYKKFKKKNNFTLFITILICLLIYFILFGIYESAKGFGFNLNLKLWLSESVFIYFIARIIKWINEKKLEEYNLPETLKILIWALLGSTISWFLIILLAYINYNLW